MLVVGLGWHFSSRKIETGGYGSLLS